MRKHSAKHAEKKLSLTKRALALCLAMIFVCSCLLPAFANGTDELPAPDAAVEADGGDPEDPVELYEDPVTEEEPIVEEEPISDEDLNEDEPMDEDSGLSTMDETPDEPIADEGGISLPIAGGDSGISLPVAGGGIVTGGDESESSDDTPKGPTITTDADGNTVYIYDTDDTTIDENPVISRSDGDHALDQVDAGFSIPTNIYHFWLKEMNSYDLAEVRTDAAAADMTVEQYLALHGKDKGCYHIMTAADGANLEDYRFTNPSSTDDPEGDSRTFAGWYTVDEFGEKHDFSFDETVYATEGKTIEVFAKWKESVRTVTADAEISAMDVTVQVDGLAGAKKLKVSALDRYDEDALMETLNEKYADSTIVAHTFELAPLDKNNDELEPESGKKATVTIKGLGLESMENVKVYHKTNLELEDLTSTASVDADGNITFQTESFSPFAVVMELTKEDVNPQPGNGNNNNWNYQNVYLYVQVIGSTAGLEINDHGWFTIGFTTAQLPAASSINVTLPMKWHWQNGTYYNNILNRVTDDIVTRYTPNSSISLSKIKWNASNDYGAIISDGADQYVPSGTGQWHLDGEISISDLGQVKVNYYKAGTTEKLLDSVIITGTTGATVDIMDVDGMHYYYKQNILASESKDGKAYEIQSMDPESGQTTIASGQMKEINLYYTDSDSKTQTVYLYTKMSDSVRNSLGLSANDLNIHGWFTVGKVEVPKLSDPPTSTAWNNHNKLKSEDDRYNLVKKTLDENRDTVDRWEPNLKIDFDQIKWDHSTLTDGTQFGLLPSDGATDYSDEDEAPISKRVWHLDGYIESVGAIKINYYLKGTTTEIQKSHIYLGTPGQFYTLTSDDQPSEITWASDFNNGDGKTYYYYDRDDTSETVVFPDNQTKVINLYYTLAAQGLTITKKVTGLMADKDQSFNFTLSFSGYTNQSDLEDVSYDYNDLMAQELSTLQKDGNGNYTFQLKHGESLILHDVPYGVTVTVTEDDYSSEEKGNYTTCWNVAAHEPLEKGTEGREATVSIGETNQCLKFTNHCETLPDMGVLLDTLPYLVILGIAAAGAIVLVARKRKHDDE